MSSAAIPWTWDANRQQYYFWSASERCWIYQGGARIYPAGTQGGIGRPTQQGNDAGTPRFSGPVVTGDYGHNRGSTMPSSSSASYRLEARPSGTNFVQSGTPATQPNMQNRSAYYSQSVPTYASATGYSGNPLGSGSSFSAQTSYSSAPAPPTPEDLPRGFAENYDANPQAITDPALFKKNIYSTRRIPGTQGNQEKLDPTYTVRSDPHDFFKRGKVFKVLWPELRGSTAQADTGTQVTRLGEQIYTKPRWFVVIKAGKDHSCTCLPIQTYQRRGVAKPRTIKAHHAIIYTGDVPPIPTKEEEPAEGEHGMLNPIRVRPCLRTAALDEMSRINFAKVYTVEHNVKVQEFGDVHPDSRHILKKQFYLCWQQSDDEED